MGAGARITHYGPASTCANYRGRIYVCSRAISVINTLLAMRRGPYTVSGASIEVVFFDETMKNGLVFRGAVHAGLAIHWIIKHTGLLEEIDRPYFDLSIVDFDFNLIKAN